jgi:hypothetical protein
MRRRSEDTCRRPRLVLGLEETPQLLVAQLEAEVRERLADNARVLDLLERPGHPEQRLELLAEVRADLVRRCEIVTAESVEARPER